MYECGLTFCRRDHFLQGDRSARGAGHPPRFRLVRFRRRRLRPEKGQDHQLQDGMVRVSARGRLSSPRGHPPGRRVVRGPAALRALPHHRLARQLLQVIIVTVVELGERGGRGHEAVDDGRAAAPAPDSGPVHGSPSHGHRYSRDAPGPPVAGGVGLRLGPLLIGVLRGAHRDAHV